MVSFPHAIVHPRAMVIKSFNASATIRAMMRVCWFIIVAFRTPRSRNHTVRAIGTRQQITFHVYFNLFHGFGAPQMSQRAWIGQHALEMGPSHEKNKGLKDTDMKKKQCDNSLWS